MEIVVGVAIGVLAVVILFSSIGIAIAIRKKCCKDKKTDAEQGQHDQKPDDAQSPEKQLIDAEDVDDPITIENVLDDEVYVEDATGVMSHCLPILKGCHELTSRLVPVTIKECSTDEQNKKVEEVARKVMPRIDDVVQLMEGPMDPRLVEARCTALYYAVSNLVLVIKGICHNESIEEWAVISLKDIERHLQVLQDESQHIRSRSLSGSMRGNGDLSSPDSCSSSASTTKSNSHASTSNTDSAESGIDIHMPLDVANSDTNKISRSSCGKSVIVDNHTDVENSSNVESPTDASNRQFAVAEVHREMEQIELEDLGYSNKGFGEITGVMAC